MRAALAGAVLAYFLSTTPCRAAAPFYVNLTAAANTSLEGDTAPAGVSAWSGEGANDMFIFPPVPSGEIARNGYRFRLIDPKHGGRAVVMLRGKGRLSDRPLRVDVPVPAVKGRFLYFLQNSVGDSAALPPGAVAGLYTVHYEDHSSANIPVRNGVELHHWWTGQWYENSGSSSWPILMGRNAYSRKWNQYVGAWAMEWENPSPGKAITSITFESMGKVAPAIFAVTITDDDYYHGPRQKDDYVRPAEAPPDYFKGKLAGEQKLLFAEMVRRKMAQGLRSVAILRSDLISVTLDTVVAGGADQGEEEAAALQRPERFTLYTGTAAGVHPVQVGRESFLYDTVDIGRYPSNNIYWHTYTLKLPSSLRNGAQYRIAVSGLKAGFKGSESFTFDDRRTFTPVIKVNQAAYSQASARRYSYLGWWAGGIGAVDYRAFPQFRVINDVTGRTVFTGAIRLRQAGDSASGEDVYQMDLSPLRTPGPYHIQVPGLGRSYPFRLGGMQHVAAVAMRGFWYQRCGAGRTAAWDYPQPPCHLRNYRNGHLVGGAEEQYDHGKLIPAAVPHSPGEPVREFRGGYHDAGDYDIFYYHLRATAEMLTAYEQTPAAFRGPGLTHSPKAVEIPGLLDEAAWGLKLYIDNQEPDGGIIAGRANDEDYGRDEWKTEWARQFGDLPPYGSFPPCSASSSTFAAVAAQYSRLIRPFDSRQASRFLNAARRGYVWAESHHTTDYERAGPSYGRLDWQKGLAWAAAELFETTGDRAYSADFVALFHDSETFKADWKTVSDLPTYWWPYAASRRTTADRTVQAELRQDLIRAADEIVTDTEKFPYRMGADGENGGWGNLVGGGYYGDTCLRAYFLTRQQKYLDAASLNADFQLGANPLSRSFITGLGSRPPAHPELRSPLYNESGVPAPGIPVFGPGGDENSVSVYPEKPPPWRRWQDDRIDALHSEFTVQSIGDAAMLYGCLWGQDHNRYGG